MSELKADNTFVFGEECLAYKKSEVDKVIENKDKEIASLKDSIGKLLKAETEQVIDEVLQRCIIYGEGFVPVEHAMRLVAELRHQKYKRCLDKAKYWVAVFYQSVDDRHRRSAEKHHYEWLELAKQFKET